jgi:hypothetical protein
MSDNSLISQAEQNLVNICRAFDDTQNFLDAMRNFGQHYITREAHKELFFEGLQKLNTAHQAAFSDAIRSCFTFTAAGSGEALAYSKERFKKAFGTDEGMQIGIMNYLDRHGQIPQGWRTDVEDAFRKEAADIIEQYNTEEK